MRLVPKFLKNTALYRKALGLYTKHIRKYGSGKSKTQRKNLKEVRSFCRKNKVDFNCIMPPEELGFTRKEGYSYEPSYSMPEIIDFLKVSKDDAIIDLGCGKGYAMWQLSKLPFGRIDGLDLAENLVDIAKENLEKLLPSDTRFHYFTCNVLDFKDIDNYNFVYMFNPFPGPVFKKVYEQIVDSIKRKNRKFTIIYQNPQFDKIFIEDNLFRRVFSANSTNVYEYKVD